MASQLNTNLPRSFWNSESNYPITQNLSKHKNRPQRLIFRTKSYPKTAHPDLTNFGSKSMISPLKVAKIMLKSMFLTPSNLKNKQKLFFQLSAQPSKNQQQKNTALHISFLQVSNQNQLKALPKWK